MRIRNIKNKQEILDNCDRVVKNPSQYKGQWQKKFNNLNKIYLEIGTGKCSFILESAKKNPNINFIGIEKSASVLAIGIKNVIDIPKNLFLLNYSASEINKIFDNEIDLLYLNFSDPWPKERHEKRRLTSDNYLKKYDLIFKNEKHIVFKTDNQLFFEYSIISFINNKYLINDISLDLHNSKINDNIITEYEEKFSQKGQRIYMINIYKK